MATDAPPGWDFFFENAGLDALSRTAGELAAGADPARLNAELRRSGLTPEQTAAVLTQAMLRLKARAKFGDLAMSLLFTPAGLEQATRAGVAARHAARFRDAGCTRVADLGCGVGAESIALLGAGIAPLAVELDPLTARIAAHNLGVAAAHHRKPHPEVRLGDAETLGPGDADGVFLDPARRTAGHSDTRRVASPSDYSPSLDFAFALADALPTGVKLGPGLDRELIPDAAEAQWVSVDGQVVETGLWFGALARPGVKRSALLLRDGTAAELSASADSPDAEVRTRGEYLYEPDGAVIRARLIGKLAHQIGAGMLSDGIAYLTADRHIPTAFAQPFRILEELPVREKELRKALATRGIGSLEIKKRGVDVDPAALRTRLKLRGSKRATLFLTRAAGAHVALLAERVTQRGLPS
ncbi:class I SAM-dependent methyltransferase [Leucobacter chromiireducens]|uniref:class I SAM-dependent methyltransferase n=1 Tax=Leucobacter chromiireducens TaxID=283877 RepID=UPI003075DC75